MRKVIWTAAVTVALALPLARAFAAEDGKALYDKNCASCHGATGKGDGPAAKAMKTKPEDFAVGAKGMSDADIVKALKEGKVGANAHPKPKLDDAQLQAVAQYVKQLAK